MSKFAHCELKVLDTIAIHRAFISAEIGPILIAVAGYLSVFSIIPCFFDVMNGQLVSRIYTNMKVSWLSSCRAVFPPCSGMHTCMAAPIKFRLAQMKHR